MEALINGQKVKVELTKTSNTYRKDCAVTLRIGGWNIIEISDKGKLRLCDGANYCKVLPKSRKHSKIIIEKGYF